MFKVDFVSQLFKHASVSSTYGTYVRHTFEFPLPMKISWRQSSSDMLLHMVADKVADMGDGMVADKVTDMVADNYYIFFLADKLLHMVASMVAELGAGIVADKVA